LSIPNNFDEPTKASLIKSDSNAWNKHVTWTRKRNGTVFEPNTRRDSFKKRQSKMKKKKDEKTVLERLPFWLLPWK
jgi:hypothetical protein